MPTSPQPKVESLRQSLKTCCLWMTGGTCYQGRFFLTCLFTSPRALASLYQSQLPEVRRVHSVLLLKIRRELSGFLIEVEAEGSMVWRWSHHQLEAAIRKRYFKSVSNVRYFHTILAEFFLGRWAGGVEKPFEFTQHQRQKFENNCYLS